MNNSNVKSIHLHNISRGFQMKFKQNQTKPNKASQIKENWNWNAISFRVNKVEIQSIFHEMKHSKRIYDVLVKNACIAFATTLEDLHLSEVSSFFDVRFRQ